MYKRIFTKISLLAILGVLFASACQKYTGSEVVLYYPDSIPQMKVYYKTANGKQYVAKQDMFFATGQLNVSGYFDVGHNKTGKWITYFDNGSTQRIEHYKDGLKDGKYVEYYPSGKKMYTAYYKKGLPDAKWVIYDGNGKKMSVIRYKDGKPITPSK